MSRFDGGGGGDGAAQTRTPDKYSANVHRISGLEFVCFNSERTFVCGVWCVARAFSHKYREDGFEYEMCC